MKLAAVVIWYNPLEIGEEKIIQNILSYSSYCEKIYIVDNSADLHGELAKKIPNSIYISNKNVGGIAGGQNRGCEKALEDGFEWAMTMDQDSIFEAEQIKEYIRLVKEYIPTDEKAVSFGPSIKNLNETLHWTKWIRFNMLSPIKRKILGKRWKPHPPKPNIELVERLIASSNIINLKKWKEVDGFDEFLFIDEVDYDFCHKLVKAKYKIIKFNQVYLNQYIGNGQKFSLFRKRTFSYSSFRLYYIFRNAFIERYRFPEYNEFYDELIKIFFIDNCVNNMSLIKNFKIYKKAKSDFKDYVRTEGTK